MEPERKSVFASGSGKFFRKLMAQKMETVKILHTWSHVECSILSIRSGCAVSKKIFLGEMKWLQTRNREAKSVQQSISLVSSYICNTMFLVGWLYLLSYPVIS